MMDGVKVKVELEDNIAEEQNLCQVLDKEDTINDQGISTSIEACYCPLCKKKYTSMWKMSCHIRQEHEKWQEDACPYCLKQFGTKKGLYCHLHKINQCSEEEQKKMASIGEIASEDTGPAPLILQQTCVKSELRVQDEELDPLALSLDDDEDQDQLAQGQFSVFN